MTQRENVKLDALLRLAEAANGLLLRSRGARGDAPQHALVHRSDLSVLHSRAVATGVRSIEPGPIRLRCFTCGRCVSNEVPADTVLRAVATCPECIQALGTEETGLPPFATFREAVQRALEAQQPSEERHALEQCQAFLCLLETLEEAQWFEDEGALMFRRQLSVLLDRVLRSPAPVRAPSPGERA